MRIKVTLELQINEHKNIHYNRVMDKIHEPTAHHLHYYLCFCKIFAKCCLQNVQDEFEESLTTYSTNIFPIP